MSLKTQTKLTIELGDICEFVSGGTPSKESENYWGGEIPWVTARDLKTAFLTATRLTLTQAGASTLKRAPKGAIVILVRGMTLFKDIPVAVLRMPMCFNQDIKALVVDPSHDSEFIAYQLLARKPYIQRLVDTAGHGTGRLDTNLLKAVLLKLPTLPEQQKIATFLGAVDSKLAALRRKQAGLERFKSGLMKRLFSQELRFTQADGSTFPDWKEWTLDELVEKNVLELGRGKVISKSDLQASPGVYPVYSSSSVGMGEFGRYGDWMFEEELITWSIDGGGKFFHRKDERFSITNVSGFMRSATNRFNYGYLIACLSEQHDKLSFDYQTKAHPSVIRKLYRISEPHPAEQRKIADALTALDTKITATAAQITKTERFKHGLLQQMFV